MRSYKRTKQLLRTVYTVKSHHGNDNLDHLADIFERIAKKSERHE